MIRRILFSLILIILAGAACFGQTSVIRNYVGMISQSFHPDVVSYMEKLQSNWNKRGHSSAAKSIDNYLKGDSGTGFVYVARDGRNFIITNYHVISHAQIGGLSVTFEKTDGEKTNFSNLSIFAADEDMDIALLTFAGGQNPFKEGLAFLTRPVQELDDVYSAGFPGLGTQMIWQLGRGIVSNASVRLPDKDDETKMIGPFIQHTAQVDPGNSGGPLLIQTPGVPTGFAVAGINTLSAIYRQGTNFSIPMNRVQSFIDKSLTQKTAGNSEELETRVTAFINGLGAPKAVYHHIAKYLSNTCTAENFEYAESELFEKAPKTVQEDVVQAFINSPVTGMSYAVAWIIENALRAKSGKISIKKDSITAIDEKNYTVNFLVNEKIITSKWINEFGIWHIETFGDIASGNKTLVKKKAEKKEADERLVIDPDAQISAAFAWILERGPCFGVDITYKSSRLWGFGLQANFAKEYIQVEMFSGIYIPIKAGKIGFTPFGILGGGIKFNEVGVSSGSKDEMDNFPVFGVSLKSGLQLTTAAVPGLYFQGAYQRNFYLGESSYDSHVVGAPPPDRNIILFSIGYSF